MSSSTENSPPKETSPPSFSEPFKHNFERLGKIEEAPDADAISVSHSTTTRRTDRNSRNRKSSFGSSYRSNLQSELSPTSRRRGSRARHSSIRKRRDSSFNYAAYQPNSVQSHTSSYQDAQPGDSDYDETSFQEFENTRANTAFNNGNFQFEVFPSEMPELESTDSGSTTMASETARRRRSSYAASEREVIPDQHVILRPKQIHQNPLTPQVLPKGFTPINRWSRYKAKYHKEWLAEFLGTFILISLGDGCSAQSLLNQQAKVNQYNAFLAALKGNTESFSGNNVTFTGSNSSLSSGNSSSLSSGNSITSSLGNNITSSLGNSGLSSGNQAGFVVVGDMLTGLTGITQNYNINTQLAWAGSVVAAFFAAGGSSISGAHLSWCITLINFLFRGSPKFKLFFPYLVAQLLGAYVAGLVLFGIYRPVILDVFPDWKTNRNFISMFVTVPLEYLSTGRQFVSEFTGSFYLVIGIFSMTDPYNNTSPEMFPVLLFFFIFTINAALSLQTGAALNFSRDLGPRLALWTVGVEHSLLFESNHHYFWIPMVAPLLGGILGAFTYDLLIFRGQESWVNKPFYQNVANFKRKLRKLTYFFRRLLLFSGKKTYYKSSGSYTVDSSDEDMDTLDHGGSKFGESDDFHSDTDSTKRRSIDNSNTVKFFNDNASLTTTNSSQPDSDQYYDVGKAKKIRDVASYALKNIPEEEYSLEKDLSEVELDPEESNENLAGYDAAVSKPSTVFKSYNKSYLTPKSTNSGKSKKEISFKSTKNKRRFVPTVETEERKTR